MKVCVLLSSYNGKKYIEQQINSIFEQEGVEVYLIVRDDGSNDGTVDLLKKIAMSRNDMAVFAGDNKGYAKSFFDLIKKAPNGFDYYSLSDQDDVWYKTKLLKAVEKLSVVKDACLYSCNLELVDSRLNHIGYMKAPEPSDFSKGRYLIDKYSYGCTMVFNSRFRDLILSHLPKSEISHDNWLGLVAVFCAKYIFDDVYLIKYRQHKENVTGGKSSFFQTWKRRLKNIKNVSILSRSIVAKELLDNFEQSFDSKTLDLLRMVANYRTSFKNRMRFFFDKRTKRKSTEKNILFRIMILFGKA